MALRADTRSRWDVGGNGEGEPVLARKRLQRLGDVGDDPAACGFADGADRRVAQERLGPRGRGKCSGPSGWLG